MNKSDRIYQVVIVIFALVFFAMLWAIVQMNTAITEATGRATSAEAKAKESDDKAAKATRESIQLKEMIGHDGGKAIDVIEQAYNEDMSKFMQGNAGANNSYKNACDFLASTLADLEKQNQDLNDQKLQLEANLENVRILYESIADRHDEERQKAEEDKKNEAQAHNATVSTLQTEVNKIKTEKETVEEQARKDVEAANEERDRMFEDRQMIANRNKSLAETLHVLTRTNVDEPCGNVTGVNQGRGVVFINRGAADGLLVRTIFTVYDPSITGISFPVATDTSYGEGICSVCKREMSLSAAKASIEVTRILGEHAAEARILDDQLANPIMPGDVIFTPIWKPGQRQVFALTNGMIIPGLGKRDGNIGQGGGDLETVIKLIRSNGGEIGAYIDNEGKLVGEVNEKTTYLVLGETTIEDAKSEAMERRSEMRKAADELGVKIISLRDLLQMMRWKNVTPGKGFGPYATDDDLRVPPKKTSNISSGTVSSLYDKEDPHTRVKNSERAKPRSSGQVSGLYDHSKQGTGTSSGSVSDLFRPRQPAVEREPEEKAGDADE